MNKSLFGSRIAILVANGFTQQDMLDTQRRLLEEGATVRIVSAEQGLVNGWLDNGWGHNFSVDSPLNEALGADYDMLVVPGGQRSADKLKMTAHTKRFIGSFLMIGKPVAMMGDAVRLLALTENARDRKVAGPESLESVMTEAGALWQGTAMHQSVNLMTGDVTDENRAEFIESATQAFIAYNENAKLAEKNAA